MAVRLRAMSNQILENVQSFLKRATDDSVVVSEELIEEFGEMCKTAFRKQFTDKRKAGSTVYYVSSIKVNQDEVTFTKDDMELMQKFQNIITTENEEIVGLWKEANKSKNGTADNESAKLVSDVEGSPFEGNE